MPHHAALSALAASFAPGGNPGTPPNVWTHSSTAEFARHYTLTEHPSLPYWIARVMIPEIGGRELAPPGGVAHLRYVVFSPSNATRVVVIVSDEGINCATDTPDDARDGLAKSCPVYTVAIDAGGHVSPIREGWGCLPPDLSDQERREGRIGSRDDEFRYDPDARRIEGRVTDDSGKPTGCTFSITAPLSID